MDKIIQEIFQEVKQAKSPINDTQLQKFLYKELVRLTLLVDDTLSEPQVFGLMSALVKKARYDVNAETDAERLAQLLALVYQEWGFHCHHAEYFHTENLLINRVIRKLRGMPVSLGAIVLYLAASLNLPLYPVNFPTQLILRAEADEQVAFIDPWDGRYISRHKLQQLYEGAFGFGAKLSIEELAVADAAELLNRFAQLAKHTLIREGQSDAALKYINTLVRRYPQDPYEIRDRGLVLAQMGCYHAAIEDLQYFIEQRPDDPSVFLLIAQMSELKQNHYSIH